MKIAVVGCGALGSYYGARLARDGEEVWFLLRSDYEVVRRRGVSVTSPEGNFNARPRCARVPEEIGPADLVIVGLKTTANHQFPILLPPLVGPNTGVLTLQNGLGNEEMLAQMFGPEKIMGGLCFVCLNRTAPGKVEHLAHGRIVLGEFRGWPEPRTHDIASIIRHSGVPCAVTDNLGRAHWEKLVWNIPFNGVGVASALPLETVTRGKMEATDPLRPCLTTEELLGDDGWQELVRELMRETMAVAKALSHELEPGLEEIQIKRTREMGAYKASTVIDFEKGRPLELESLFLEPLRQAVRAGVAVPRLRQLCGILGQLETRRQPESLPR